MATIPDADNVIHACYVKPHGAVRLLDKPTFNCAASETPISWNGGGPTAAFIGHHRHHFGSNVIDGPQFSNVVSVTLPAGTYVVNATAAFTGGTAPAPVQCQIIGTAAPLSGAVQASIGQGNSTLVIPLATAFTLPTPDKISVACRSSNFVSTQPSAITAIRVGTLTVQNSLD